MELHPPAGKLHSHSIPVRGPAKEEFTDVTYRTEKTSDSQRFGIALIAVMAPLAYCFSAIPCYGADVVAPLIQESSISIPNVPVGPYADHLAVDVAGGRIFATPQAAKAVAVVDLKSRSVVKMIADISDPHGIYYSEDLKRLFVVDGTSGDVKVYSGQDYALIKTIRDVEAGDSLVYDRMSRAIYINSSGEDAGKAQSFVSVVDINRMEKIGTISIASPYLEASAVDPTRGLLYVEGESDVFLIDLKTRKTKSRWRLSGKHRNKAIVLDAVRGRLYLACRDSPMHGSIVVLNAANGSLVTTLPIDGWADSIFLDQKRKRIFVSTGAGYIDTYSIDPAGAYHEEQRVETTILAKTSEFSSRLNRLYVDVPHLGDFGSAEVLVFRPVP